MLLPNTDKQPPLAGGVPVAGRCLPLQPSSFPHAFFVCTRWHHLVTDPRFRRRLRYHCNPPLLGFFDESYDLSFLTTLEAANRVPPERFSFSLLRDDDDRICRPIECRHGLVLIFVTKRFQGCKFSTLPSGDL